MDENPFARSRRSNLRLLVSRTFASAQWTRSQKRLRKTPCSLQCSQIVARIKSQYNAKNVAGMARFGISAKNTYGLSIPTLRKMAKEIGRNHSLALLLWETEMHEARLLAGFIGDPTELTPSQMDKWVAGFDSWDVCDQVCGNLFDCHPLAHKKAKEWANSKEEFIRRAGFALMAALSVHDKKATNAQFLSFLPIIKKYSHDERNFVKKAVNWALRQIGKRNIALNKAAIKAAKEILAQDTKSARFIANDALRELQSAAVQKRLRERK
ncbi:DNA alkylation repair protein [Candidatus Micrarchaeota archaeon]|nr:DNA alkylation repair protein [Candidatus Micrarchaeota archaeon]